MATGRPRFYWDTVVLIAWIKDEKRAPADMAGLAEVAEMVDRGKAILMTSVLWRAEVLSDSMTSAQRTRLEAVFDDRSVIELQIDSRVMTLAGEIRRFHKASKKKDVIHNIRVPDAIHLASAIQFEATEFHTFDGAKTGRKAGLLTLDGNVAGRRLRVCTPSADQLRLDFGAREDSDDADTNQS